MRAKRTGFTLVEILIIAVILAVLAAVVVPPLADSARDERPSTAEFNLGAMRSVMATYRHQHAGANAPLDREHRSLPGLTAKTDAAGVVRDDGEFGPYLVELPLNPFTGCAEVKAAPHVPPTRADVTPDHRGGWLYDAPSGQIWLDSDTLGEFSW